MGQGGAAGERPAGGARRLQPPTLDAQPKDVSRGVLEGSKLAERIRTHGLDVNKLKKLLRELKDNGLTSPEFADIASELTPLVNKGRGEAVLGSFARIAGAVEPQDLAGLRRRFYEDRLSGRSLGDISCEELCAAYVLASRSAGGVGELGSWMRGFGDDELGEAVLRLQAFTAGTGGWDRWKTQSLITNTIGFMASRMRSQDKLMELAKSMMDGIPGNDRDHTQLERGRMDFYRGGEFTAVAAVAAHVEDAGFRDEIAGELLNVGFRSLDYSASAALRAASQLATSGEARGRGLRKLPDDRIIAVAERFSGYLDYPDEELSRAAGKAIGKAIAKLEDDRLFELNLNSLAGADGEKGAVRGCRWNGMDLARENTVRALANVGAYSVDTGRRMLVLDRLVEYLDDPAKKVRDTAVRGILKTYRGFTDARDFDRLADHVRPYLDHPIADVRESASQCLLGLAKNLKEYAGKLGADSRKKPGWMLGRATMAEFSARKQPEVTDDTRLTFLEKMVERIIKVDASSYPGYRGGDRPVFYKDCEDTKYSEVAWEFCGLNSISHTPMTGGEQPEGWRPDSYKKGQKRSWVGETVQAIESPQVREQAAVALGRMHAETGIYLYSEKIGLPKLLREMPGDARIRVLREVSDMGSQGAWVAGRLLRHGDDDQLILDTVVKLTSDGEGEKFTHKDEKVLVDLMRNIDDDGMHVQAAKNVIAVWARNPWNWGLSSTLSNGCQGRREPPCKEEIADALLDRLDRRQLSKGLQLFDAVTSVISGYGWDRIKLWPDSIRKVIPYLSHPEKVLRKEAKDKFEHGLHRLKPQERTPFLEAVAENLHHPVRAVREEAQEIINRYAVDEAAAEWMIADKAACFEMDDAARLKYLRKLTADCLTPENICGVLDFHVQVAQEMGSDITRRVAISMIENNPAYRPKGKGGKPRELHKYEDDRLGCMITHGEHEVFQAKTGIMLAFRDEDVKLRFLLDGIVDDNSELIKHLGYMTLDWSMKYAKSFSKDEAGDSRRVRVIKALDSSTILGEKWNTRDIRMEIISSIADPALRADYCVGVLGEEMRYCRDVREWATRTARRLPKTPEGDADRKRIIEAISDQDAMYEDDSVRGMLWDLDRIACACSTDEGKLDCYRMMLTKARPATVEGIVGLARSIAKEFTDDEAGDKQRAALLNVLDSTPHLDKAAPVVTKAKTEVLTTLSNPEERIQHLSSIFSTVNAESAEQALNWAAKFAEGLGDEDKEQVLNVIDGAAGLADQVVAGLVAKSRAQIANTLSTFDGRYHHLTAMISTATAGNAEAVLKWAADFAEETSLYERKLISEIDNAPGLKGANRAAAVMDAKTKIVKKLGMDADVDYALQFMGEWIPENSEVLDKWMGKVVDWVVSRPDPYCKRRKRLLSGLEGCEAVMGDHRYIELRMRLIDSLNPAERLKRTNAMVDDTTPETVHEILPWAAEYAKGLDGDPRSQLEDAIRATRDRKDPECIKAATRAQISMLGSREPGEQFTDCLKLVQEANVYNGGDILDFALGVAAALKDPDDTQRGQLMSAIDANKELHRAELAVMTANTMRDMVFTYNNAEKQMEAVETYLSATSSAENAWAVAKVARKMEDGERKRRVAERMMGTLESVSNPEVYESMLHALAQLGPLDRDFALGVIKRFRHTDNKGLRISQYAALHAELTGVIPGTVSHQVTLDKAGTVIDGWEGLWIYHERPYLDLVAAGVFDCEADGDSWPVKEPGWDHKAAGSHGRNVFNQSWPVRDDESTYAVEIKGSGSYEGRGGTTYSSSGGEKMSSGTIYGGDVRGLVRMQMLQADEMRNAYNTCRVDREATLAVGIKADELEDILEDMGVYYLGGIESVLKVGGGEAVAPAWVASTTENRQLTIAYDEDKKKATVCEDSGEVKAVFDAEYDAGTQTLKLKAQADKAIRYAEEKYGVRVDVFYEPVAAAKPVELPVLDESGAGRSLVDARVAIKKVTQLEGMSLAGGTAEIAKHQREFAYRNPVPERNEELREIKESLYGWEKVFHYYGYILEENPGELPTVRDRETGEEVSYMKAAEEVYFGFEARCAIACHDVHNIRGGALSSSGGSVFTGHNFNPLTAKDYDTVWFREHYEEMLEREGLRVQGDGTREATIRHYQENDVRAAKSMIGELARILNIRNRVAQARSVFDEIYDMGRKQYSFKMAA